MLVHLLQLSLFKLSQCNLSLLYYPLLLCLLLSTNQNLTMVERTIGAIHSLIEAIATSITTVVITTTIVEIAVIKAPAMLKVLPPSKFLVKYVDLPVMRLLTTLIA
ncbi:hypothetical protein ACFX2J_004216 [Malus domestica]